MSTEEKIQEVAESWAKIKEGIKNLSADAQDLTAQLRAMERIPMEGYRQFQKATRALQDLNRTINGVKPVFEYPEATSPNAFMPVTQESEQAIPAETEEQAEEETARLVLADNQTKPRRKKS